MKKISIFILFVLAVLPSMAKKWTAGEVTDLITRVNTYWQQHNKAEVRSFWDNAAYHTGNMEVYRLLKNEQMLDYTRRWAYHNDWSGATEADPSRWKYATYGEGKDFVLFGDWQVCFQTYIDLYNLAIANGSTDADNYFMVKRAKEVMHYEAYSANNDYWWWSDALYMVMPVMTKMYRLTGDVHYLDKLYENLLYSDSIMLDKETGLYFRDARYVYPKHKSVNGKKDFWARGDGWVLAGLAKVLQDMPNDYSHRQFFVDKFRRMAATVAKTQQKEGYWTRSMLDASHAPGPETSGTAFFAYGILWGVNNGILPQKDYQKCIDRAWTYITETAVQTDGKVGYVQPIGDRAIPGQTVDANSQANFGVGAVLLAACEYYRYIVKNRNKYLFVYFTGNAPEQEQIMYAVSDDGFNYTPLNGGHPVIASDSIALTKCVRDPHILRTKNGEFLMVATDMRSSLGWASNRGIVLLKSRDLVHWQHHTVHFPDKYHGKNFANVTRVWAPQTIYDEKAGKYMVYFSLLTNDGTIPYDRVYWAYANADFSDLEGDPQVLFDFHAPAIDTDIVQDKSGEYHLFFKTEQDGAHKGIRQYTFRNLHDPSSWTLLDGFCEQTKDNVEGAGVFPLIDGGWCLMYDCYMSGHYQFTRSGDLRSFKWMADTKTSGAFTPRHGTVIQITPKEYGKLLECFGYL